MTDRITEVAVGRRALQLREQQADAYGPTLGPDGDIFKCGSLAYWWIAGRTRRCPTPGTAEAP